jgi:hypothetical protein
MGYNTHITGAITMTPPIAWAEYQARPEPVTSGRLPYQHTDNSFDAERIEVGSTALAVDATREVDAAGIERITRQITAIVPLYEEPYKAYDLTSGINQVLTDFGRARDGKPRTFTGYLECLGEDAERWRVYVRDGRAVEATADITYTEPDGSPVGVKPVGETVYGITDLPAQ